MKRIFLSLSIVSCLLLVVAFGIGWSVAQASEPVTAMRRAISLHLLVALGASLMCLMVHAIALTYFMGTGRWIEETAEAYRLGEEPRRANIQLKYQTIPGMIGCIVAVIVTGGFGAASGIGTPGGRTWTSSAHFLLACITVTANIFVSWLEYAAISRNASLVEAVVTDVKRIRREKGLTD